MHGIPSQTLVAGKRIKVHESPDFEDSYGNPLSYSAVSDYVASVTAVTENHLKTVRGVARGDARITVRAGDPEGWSARQAFSVTVQSGEPAAMGSLPPQTVPRGETVAVDLSPFFYDSDGDPLTHAAASSGPAAARVLSVERSHAPLAPPRQSPVPGLRSHRRTEPGRSCGMTSRRDGR